MGYKDKLHARIESLTREKSTLEVETSQIVDQAIALNSTLDYEPYSKWNDSWTGAMKTIKASLAPENATYISSVP